MRFTPEQLEAIKKETVFRSDGTSALLYQLAEELERYQNGVKTFIDKNYRGNSKADREDYVASVVAKDIYDLRKLIVE